MQTAGGLGRGSLLFGHAREFRTERIELLLQLARSARDVTRIRLGAIPVTIVSSPELAHALLVENPDRIRTSFFMNLFAAPLVGGGLLRLEGDAHKRRRRMVAPAFMPRRITGYASEMVQRAQRSAARMLELGQVDISEESMRVTLEIVGKTLFGTEVGDSAEDVGEALTEAMSCMLSSITSVVPFPPQIPTPNNRRYMRATHRLDAIIYRMIRERRDSEAEHNDVLSILMAARDEDDGTALSDRDVRDEAMTLFLAGHETTANTLAWTMYLLAKHPEVRARLECEVDALGGRALTAADLSQLPYCLRVIKEAMRLIPPVYMLGRRIGEDIVLKGQRFNRGQTVFVNVIGIHRRADLYADPEQFDPERWLPEREKQLQRQAFMPFGAGPRICVGNHFAWMEAQLVLATWIQHLRCELMSERVPEFEALITLRPRGGIAMRMSARSAAASITQGAPHAP